MAALTRELLTSLGFSVIHVSSAEAALGALANSRDIDAVLSDVMMPGGVSGLELAREIRRRHPALTILLTTGYVESVADMNDGEFSLLLKPYTVESLARALGIVARQESTWRASSTVPTVPTLLSLPPLSYTICTRLHRRHSCIQGDLVIVSHARSPFASTLVFALVLTAAACGGGGELCRFG